MDKELPPYITRDGDLIAIQPFLMDILVYLFMLDADWDSLQKMCDRYLNLPGSKTVYRPILPFVMFYASKCDVQPQDPKIGWCEEVDFGFWVPCAAGHVDGNEFKVDRLVVFTPNLWVDSSIPLVGGRSVLGYPKQIAKMVMPADPSDQAFFSVDTQVLPAYGPDSRVVWKRLIEVNKSDSGLWGDLKQLWSGGDTILKAVEEVLNQHGPGRYPVPTVSLVMQLLNALKMVMPNVYLKQYPDIVDGKKACYQAIVEAPIDVTSGITGGFLFGEYDVRIWEFESHQLVKSMGLKTASQEGNLSTCKSLVHGWTRFTSMVQPGTVIYQST